MYVSATKDNQSGFNYNGYNNTARAKHRGYVLLLRAIILIIESFNRTIYFIFTFNI